MATREELFAAMRLISDYCGNCVFCRDCPLSYDKGKRCMITFSDATAPCDWRDPEEVEGEYE